MTQKWNSPTYPKSDATQTGDVFMGYALNGIDTAATIDAGTTDPSTGAPTPWGADDVGRRWLDMTDADNPVMKIWQQLTGTPTYGWRTMRLLKTIFCSAPGTVTFTSTSPAAADVAWEDVSLASLLDTLQDASQTRPRVVAVLLRFKIRTGASETIPTTDDCYLAVRPKGTTAARYIYPQVQNRYIERDIWVALDSSEVFQFMVDVGGGTPAFEYAAEVVALMESF